AIFAILSIIGVITMAFVYMQVPTLLGLGRMTVTLELPSSGNLYRFSNVTYRGVQMGTVTAVRLTDDSAKATLSLSTSPKIPADLLADVRSVSAVGEQYVDLQPRTDAAPYLHNGSVIPVGQTSIPQPVGPMLDQASALIKSIPNDKVRALLNESFTAFNGSGYDQASLFDASARVAADANGVSDQTRTLIDDTGPLLDSQAQTADSIRLWARSLAGVTDQVVTDDTQLRRLLQDGPGAARQATALFEQIKPTLPVLLANLTSLGQVAVTYHASLEQILVLFPPIEATVNYNLPQNSYIAGAPPNGFHVQTGDPPPCYVGFLPASQWRSPADTTTIDTPDGLYCKLPQDSPILVRGARNYPCMGHPGKRAPTVEICNSDKPFVPLAMHQHWTGPYPLDPNLVSQGVPVDDRVGFGLGERGSNIYGPVEGTPLPAGPGPGNAVPPPAGPGPGNAVLPASPGPGNAAPPAPPADAAPLPGAGAPEVAPSSFGRNESGSGPAVAFAEYNPRTGSYLGSDGRLYRQSDLVAPSDQHAKTWKDLVLTQS
ncbi:MAG TPA: MlaD family protein, partial [Mycobacterium sp.]|nr:MlaD family protein [Mycobacterium sp.]